MSEQQKPPVPPLDEAKTTTLDIHSEVGKPTRHRTPPKLLGNRTGVEEWRALETPADVKRFIRWCILSARTGHLTPQDASRLAQCGMHLLHIIEVAEQAVEMQELHEKLDKYQRELMALIEERDRRLAQQRPITH